MSDYLFFTHQYDRGIELVKRMIEIHPEDAVVEWWHLFHHYSAKGLQANTIEALAHTLLAMDYTKEAEALQKTYAKSGYRTALEQLAHWMEEQPDSDFNFPEPTAEIYALIGNKDKVFFWLNKAYQERDSFLLNLAVTPILDPVRPDPRYKALVKKIGFPQVIDN